ncbi:MAG: Flp pilus assembly protein CpaB [Anaerolineales bacterium]|nr:Flp pilus assembly protein CpaB [Anaerolineales bacterium]
MEQKKTTTPETTPNWAGGFRRRIPFYILAAIIFGLLAALLAFFYLDRLRREALPTEQTVVLTTDLDAGSQLTSEQVILRAVPADVIPHGALGDTGQAVGRVLARPMKTNEIILRSDFVGEAGSGLSARLPDGRWAMVFPAGWLVSPVPSLVPGDRLDLMAYQAGQPVTEVGIIVSNVEVLNFRGTPAEPERLTLAVDIDQATAVLYARTNGFSLLALLKPEAN